MRILHTSDTERGQIYVPVVNWLMLVAVIVLVLSSAVGALAGAYGIAVSGTMIVTTLLMASRHGGTAGALKAAMVIALALFGALALFFSSNMTKLFNGGWMPLLLGARFS
jgi:KUP system potassium uptake protein